MSRPTNNYKISNLDFIKSLAEIAEPFNSTFLDGYDEYEENISAYEISDTRECFLSVLNKVGEDGCEILTDKVVNYIDDVSNIDTTIPSALLSQAESLSYPYKDKKIVEQLSRLTKCSPLLQSLVWATSTNAQNSKTILNRINILSNNQLVSPDISSIYSTDELNDKISANIYNIFDNNIFNKKYLYLDDNNNVTDISSPAVIDFSWIAYKLFESDIIRNNSALTSFEDYVIDFGKYNRTIFAIICYTYLYSKIYSDKSGIKNVELDIDRLNVLAKYYLPFLYNNNLFDPIQAAWSIIYDTATISDYDDCNHNIINEFIKCFNEKLNNIAYDATLNAIGNVNSANTSFISKLNANSFTYQQLIVDMIEDVRSLFSIDINDYIDPNFFELYINTGDICKKQDALGFSYLDSKYLLSKKVNWNNYISDIVKNIFDLGKKIRMLREDLRLMTLRNSYKGTAALIQFAVLEYLRDCIGDLIYVVQEEYNIQHPDNQVHVNQSDISNIVSIIESNNNAAQSQIAVGEYWDYTEDFNRTFDEQNNIFPDWQDPEGKNESRGWLSYGSLSERDISSFYVDHLNIPTEILKDKSTKKLAPNIMLRHFLKLVYDSGVFSSRTNDNYEAIYSGNINETTNQSPWVAWKNKEYISKQIHPYIWNFTTSIVKRLYKSGAVTTAIQNAEYELLSQHIGELGNIVNQYRLSENFVDSSGYVTRYENADHSKNEITKSYDGIVYPKFAYDLVSANILDEDAISANWNKDYNIYKKWYVDQGIALTEHGAEREINVLQKLVTDEYFLKSINNDNTLDIAVDNDSALQNYCIDRYETTYAVTPECDFKKVSTLEYGKPKRIYVSKNDIVFLVYEDKILYSLDNGKAWIEKELIIDEPSATIFNDIVSFGDYAYLATNFGIFKFNIFDNSQTTCIYKYCNCVSLAIENESIINCCTLRTTWVRGGVWRTENGGTSWEKIADVGNFSNDTTIKIINPKLLAYFMYDYSTKVLPSIVYLTYIEDDNSWQYSIRELFTFDRWEEPQYFRQTLLECANGELYLRLRDDNIYTSVGKSSVRQRHEEFDGFDHLATRDGVIFYLTKDNEFWTHFGHELLYKENRYPVMRPLIKQVKTNDGQDLNLGMLFVKADGNIDNRIFSGRYCAKADGFPRVTVSEDGTHMLLRISETELRSYNITTHKNSNDEFEQALQLNSIISCDPILFNPEYFNDSLIKTVDDAFYILIPKYDKNTNAFDTYLWYIKNKQPNVLVTKQHFNNISESDLFGTGLVLHNKNSILINSYYVNKQQSVSNSTDISAIYSDIELAKNNHRTEQQNWTDSRSSFDIMNQFVQLYVSPNYDSLRTIDKFEPFEISTSISNELSAYPSVDLHFETIDERFNLPEISSKINNVKIENGIIEPTLLSSTVLPFTRLFNINSDAGFNPVYIGETGKMIINNIADDPSSQTQQLTLAKSTGAAFELLGPPNDFDTTVAYEQDGSESDGDEDYIDGLNENDYAFSRIHELYSHNQNYAQSFDRSSSVYKYGYASIIEDDNYKDDVYRIKDIKRIKLDTLTTNNKAVTNSVNFGSIPTPDTGYDYNRIYMFLGTTNSLYSLVPRKQTTYLQNKDDSESEFYKLVQALNSNNPYNIEYQNTSIFDKIRFAQNSIEISGNVYELINSELMLIQIEGKNNQSETVDGKRVVQPPNFMLSTDDLKAKMMWNGQVYVSENDIDFHMHVPHISVTHAYTDISTNCRDIQEDFLGISDYPEISSGSLVFTITDIDSEKMNQQLPDQVEKQSKLHSVTVEAINDFLRINELKSGSTRFDTLNYSFTPWKLIDLSLKRVEDGTTDIGFENKADSVDTEYIVQPYKNPVRIRQDASNKYTISFWRKAEKNTEDGITAKVENILPFEEKLLATSPNSSKTDGTVITEHGPIYANEHESIADLLSKNPFTPQLRVQWILEDGVIKLKFNNAANGDSAFVNVNAQLEYKSLSVYNEAKIISPGESEYLDIVAPYHIMVGRTIFYNIPIMRVYVTNISDDKPKFMMTILNDRVDKQVQLESNNYALVFVSSSTPEESNSDNIYVTAYVSPLVSINQTKPPSVSNAIALSELAFNFDVANIINRNDVFAENEDEIKALVNPRYINAITPSNKISESAQTYVNYDKHMHQVRIAEPYGNAQDGFSTVNIKIDLSNMADYTLKNALLTAHGDVVAYDKNENAVNIVKIYGCSLDRIGKKHVLSVKRNTTSNSSVLSITQNSGRETAVMVNPDCAHPVTEESEKCILTFKDDDEQIIAIQAYVKGTLASQIIPPNVPTKQPNPEYSYTFAGWTPALATVTDDATYTATYNSITNRYTITWKNYNESVISTDLLNYGDTPVYSGDTPTKPADAEYSYEFDGWEPEIATVTDNATYTAHFTPSINTYEITWVMDDGETPIGEPTSVEYGVVPTHSNPTKPSDEEYSYEFVRWDPTPVAVTGPATYRAVFESSPL